MGFLTQEGLEKLGLRSFGKNVLISDTATFYNAGSISIGDNTRIDDFSVLSGGNGLNIGKYVHIAVHVSILGGGQLDIRDFAGLSTKVSVFTSEEPYDGFYMTNPTVPGVLRDTTPMYSFIGKHTVVGAGSIILAGACIADCWRNSKSGYQYDTDNFA